MKLLKNRTKKFVRIIIGNAEYGFKGIKKPTKTITVIDTTVDEVHNKFLEMIKKEKKK